MRWTATANDDAYGLMTAKGEPTLACLAKELFAQHVRYGDWVRFPGYRNESGNIDAVIAWSDDGRRSCVFVHTGDGPQALTVADWDDGLPGRNGPESRYKYRHPSCVRYAQRNGPTGWIRRCGGDQRRAGYRSQQGLVIS